jgi:hypothetical protein
VERLPVASCCRAERHRVRVRGSEVSRVGRHPVKARARTAPEALAETMSRRISGAFAQYKITTEEVTAFKELLDKHGLPVFAAIVFPDAIRDLNEKSKARKSKP